MQKHFERNENGLDDNDNYAFEKKVLSKIIFSCLTEIVDF